MLGGGAETLDGLMISEMLAFALDRVLAAQLLALMTHNNTAKVFLIIMFDLLLKVAYISLLMPSHAPVKAVELCFELS